MTTAAPGEASHVAFLRAINVGGRRVTMAELTDACTSSGVAVVGTWQATGNVILAEAGATARDLEDRLERGLAAALGIEIPTIVRTADEVWAIAVAAPFDEEALASTAGRVQVLFVRDRVDAAARREVLRLVPDEDRVLVEDDVVWWLPVDGVSGSSLPVRRVERLVGDATMRSQRAVAGLAARHLTGLDHADRD